MLIHQSRRLEHAAPQCFWTVCVVSLLLSACGGGGAPPQQSAPPPDQGGPPPNTTVLGSALPGARPMAGPRSFVTYESGQVRPLALSFDSNRLFAANTPDNRLEVFDLASGVPVADHSVPVGMEPVALAVAPDGKVWVVNHLSDSVSIVDVQQTPPRVVKTLWVGDEPRDIVFGGVGRTRAFITTAHRGQNSPVDPALETPGIGRADVWVFDSENLDGPALTIVTLFADKPRALAVSPDGASVYAAAFLSGNRTTTLPPAAFNKRQPTDSADGFEQPDTGLIVRFTGSNWIDERGTVYNGSVPFSLPDFDVFEIDALANPPVEINQFAGVGTTLFNMAVNPVTGDLYISNTQARNHVRFSGPATRALTTVRGHVADNRITLVRNGSVEPRVLNKHIDFSQQSGTQADRDLSLSMPMEMAVSSDGDTLYVTAFGSSKIGVYDRAELEEDSFVPSATGQIEVSGGGPSGIVLDTQRNQAYVLTRFDNGISVVDLTSMEESEHILMFNPEPEAVVIGRPFLYDARLTSGNGNDSCATCHVFGNVDALAWDLGDPDGTLTNIPNTFIPISPPAPPIFFHPMKGPMTTQSMRGLMGHGPMHWRGDRTGVNRVGGETLEEAAFKEFNEAFSALMGRDQPLSDADMQAFTDFSMELTYPPNPIRALDNSLTPIEAGGESLFRNGIVRQNTGILEVCVQCHTLDPMNMQFGTRGLSSDNIQTGERNFKIPHFRDQYQKVGMFGFGVGATATGPQIRGFSFNHNGATTSNFILADLGMPRAQLTQIRSFLYAFPTESAPIVGQQVTIDQETADTVRLDLLVQRALVTDPIPECDLIAKGVIAGEARGWVLEQDGRFRSDRSSDTLLTDSQLRELAESPGNTVTFTCAPWGSGFRMGIDRDLDGVLDAD